MMENNRPKIGLALSGASGRSIGHIAIIEVLQKHNIPIDIIVGCSSSSLVTVGHAAGTMPFIKNLFMTITRKRFFEFCSTRGSKGGLFHLRNVAAEQELRKLTLGKKFEDMPIKIGVTATDLHTGELITINSGDMMQGIRATTCIPGLFEPVVIGNRLLVDGGLVNIVPTIPVKQMGADIVIGVDLALTKFIYQRKMWIWRIIRRFRRITGIHYLQHEIIQPMTSKILDQIIQTNGTKPRVHVPNMFRVLSWAVDHSFDVEKEWREENRACDLMITPRLEQYDKLGFDKMQTVYDNSRAAAEAAIPQIKLLIQNFEKQKMKEPVLNDQAK